MSIVIDSDLTTLMSKLNISALKMQQEYALMTIEQIVEAEAESGNQLAVEYAKELFQSPDMLVKIFKLADPNNKLEILSEMTSAQLQEFLPLMEEEDLNEGLKFFTQDKLMKMLEEIPPEQLVNTVFQMFSQEEVVQYLPEDQLDKFLTDTDIDKNQVLKHLTSIPPEYLAQMYESVSGENSDKMNSGQIIDKISDFNPLQFQDALLSMQPIAKQQLTLNLGKEHTELFQNFDAHAYTNMISTYKQQPEVVKAMSVIEPEEKIKMLDELPNDLLSIVITQIDARVFADTLIKENPELLAQIILQ